MLIHVCSKNHRNSLESERFFLYFFEPRMKVCYIYFIYEDRKAAHAGIFKRFLLFRSIYLALTQERYIFQKNLFHFYKAFLQATCIIKARSVDKAYWTKPSKLYVFRTASLVVPVSETITILCPLM